MGGKIEKLERVMNDFCKVIEIGKDVDLIKNPARICFYTGNYFSTEKEVIKFAERYGLEKDNSISKYNKENKFEIRFRLAK